jgi:hypothetical protein
VQYLEELMKITLEVEARALATLVHAANAKCPRQDYQDMLLKKVEAARQYMYDPARSPHSAHGAYNALRRAGQLCHTRMWRRT